MTSFYFTKEICFLRTLVLKMDFKNTILLTVIVFLLSSILKSLMLLHFPVQFIQISACL